MKEFIEYIVKNLVDEPHLVDVECVDDGVGMRVEVKVNSGEVGKVVGKKGATIKALRQIAQTVCARLGCKVRVDLIQ